MNDEHVGAWLGAYRDGELGSAQAEGVRAHVAHCAQCAADLAALDRLSALLRAQGPATYRLSEEAFVAAVSGRLGAAVPDGTRPSLLDLGWRVGPAAVLVFWALLQAVLITSSLVLAALSFGAGGAAVAGAIPGSPAPSLLTLLLGGSVPDLAVLAGVAVSQGQVLALTLTVNVLAPLAIAFVYGAALAGWHSHRQPVLA